jgi:hypothetical protein
VNVVREGEVKEKKTQRGKASSNQPSTPHKDNEDARLKCMCDLFCFVLFSFILLLFIF